MQRRQHSCFSGVLFWRAWCGSTYTRETHIQHFLNRSLAWLACPRRHQHLPGGIYRKGEEWLHLSPNVEESTVKA